MSYVLVYLLIRIYKGKTIEVTETVSNSSILSDNQLVYPFDDTQFIIAHRIYLDATDYDWVFESTLTSLYQYDVTEDETGEHHTKIEYYDVEPCNNTHFTDKEFDDIPVLNRMGWISSNFSITGSSFSK